MQERLVEALRQTQSPDKPTRVSAEAELTAGVRADPGRVLPLLVGLSANPAMGSEAAQLAAIRAKNFLVFDADASVGEVIGAEGEAALKAALLQALPLAREAVRRTLLVLVATLLKEGTGDSADDESSFQRMLHGGGGGVSPDAAWPELVPALVEALTGVAAANPAAADAAAVTERAIAAVQTLYVAVKPFKLVYAVSEKEQHEVSNQILPLLPPLLARHDLRLSHAAFKVFEALIATATPPTMRDVTVFKAWMTHLLGFTQQARPQFVVASAEYRRYLQCMKRVARVSVLLLQLATRSGKGKKKAGGGNRRLADYFIEHCAPDFAIMWGEWLRHVVLLPPADLEVHRKINAPALRYWRELIASERLYRGLPWDQVAADIFLPFLAFTPADEELWDADPAEFVRQLMSSGEDQTSCRTIAMKGIVTLVGSGAKRPYVSAGHLPSFLAVLQQRLQVGEAGADPTIAGHPLGKPADGILDPALSLQAPGVAAVDASMFALGMLRPVIRRNPAVMAQMESVLSTLVAPRLHAPQAALRAKAVWICGLYASAPFSRPDTFSAMLQAVTGLIDDANQLVRMQVVASCASFLALERSQPFVRQILMPTVEECLRMLQAVTNEYAVLTLTVIIEAYGPELTGYLQRIGDTLVHNFRSARTEVRAAMGAGGDENDEALTRHMQVHGMAGLHTLRALQELLAAMELRPEGVPRLAPAVFGAVADVVGCGDEDLMDAAVDVAAGAVMSGRGLASCPEMWQLVDTVVSNVVDGNGCDYFAHHMAFLDNVMSFNTAAFLGDAGRLQQLVAVYRKMLSTEIVVMPADVRAAPELLSSVLQYATALRGSAPAALGGLNAAVEPFLQLTMQALAAKNDGGVRAALVTVVLDAVLYDAPSTVAVLDAMGATEAFLQNYVPFYQQHKKRFFAGPMLRKVHAMGVSELVGILAATGRLQVAGAEALQTAAQGAMAIVAECVHANAAGAAALVAKGLLHDEEANGEDEGYETDDSMDAAENADEEGIGETVETDSEADDDDLRVESPLDAVNEAGAVTGTLRRMHQDLGTAAESLLAGLLANCTFDPATIVPGRSPAARPANPGAALQGAAAMQQLLAAAEPQLSSLAEAQAALRAKARAVHDERSRVTAQSP